ncbi:DsbA family protein [Pontibacter silvestris]|uniref:DsbA family protein n=1 Tax=Pontibacter silvestris TaxID=2305183 RepID=A0ABW4WX66_9BACT|nr:DsbA family protein [Pontibacter silvestris]MCC9137021.1 DsbA family protein [Pontibacter silvestris]
MTEDKKTQNKESENEAGLVEIQVYTDPLCCWSWAFEPQWRKLRYEFSGKIRWRYRMAGLIPNWNTYRDPVNHVNKPIQMGPVWLEAKHLSGMPLEDKVWFHNPPVSSYPSCIAVKCAGLQSAEAAEMYLRRVREAVMLHGKDISQREVLLEVARELARESPDLLNLTEFEHELSGEAARRAFEEDLKQVRYHRISRYPALTINKPGQPGLLIVGYRPYEALVSTLKKVAPELEPVQQVKNAEEYRKFWNGATDREIEEALNSDKQGHPASAEKSFES